MIRHLGILCLTAICVAQVPARGDRKTASTDTSRYENNVIGISYLMPSGYSVVAKNVESERQRAIGQGILFVADKLTGRPFKNRIVLASDEAKHYGKSSTEPALSFKGFATKLLSLNAKRPGVTVTKPLIALASNGMTLYRGDYVEAFPEATFHKVFVCAEINGYWLSWTFVSTEASELEELVESVLAAKFSLQARPPKAS